MSVLNIKSIESMSPVILLSLMLAACGGGSAASYSPTNANNNPGAVANSLPSPTVTINAGSSSIAYNASTNISWTSTNSTSCSSSSGGGTGTTGSFNTGALTTTTTYIVTCAGAGGSTSQSKIITVAPSTITGFVNTGGGVVTVTTANTLTNGMIVTIGGTTSYNGTYTVSNVTPTSFSIIHTFINASETGYWQLGGGMISGCSATGATSAITLSTSPSRFTGVAPLSVFFDAAETTATATTKPFHDIEYKWDFGDSAGSPVNGTMWNTGSRAGISSRNIATGAEAAHVFETPGVYTVTVTATDGTNTVTNNCARIVVLNPDTEFSGTKTTCIAATSMPVAGSGGCPAGAGTAQQASFQTAINSYAKTGTRVLFKRGDTFTSASAARISVTGPGIIGAYGTGTSPSMRMSGNSALIMLSSSTTPYIKDWRVMDLDLDGMSRASSTGIKADGGFNQLLALRLNIHNMVTGIDAGPYTIAYWNTNGRPGHAVFEEWAIVDSTINAEAGCSYGCDWRIYVIGKKLSIQGNSLDNYANGGTHTIRSEYTNKGVISNNYIARPGSTMHALKLHSTAWEAGVPLMPSLFSPATGYTEKVIVSDNKIVGASNAWTVSFGPQNAQRDERVRDIVVERNWFVAGAGTQLAIEASASDATYRNNLCDITGASSHTCFYTGQRGIEPPSNNVQFYNNTFYSGSTGNFTGVSIGPTATNVTVINNLGYAPSATSPVMISGTGASGLVASINSTNLQIKNSSPGWVATTPSNPIDYKLNSGSYALGAGGSVPVFSDFFLQNRLSYDFGAAVQ